MNEGGKSRGKPEANYKATLNQHVNCEGEKENYWLFLQLFTRQLTKKTNSAIKFHRSFVSQKKLLWTHLQTLWMFVYRLNLSEVETSGPAS